jgi:FkbM family methyltransferase
MNWALVHVRLRKLLAIARNRLYRHAFLRHGVAPAIDHAAILQRLPFDFVVDVGANRGQFSLVCRQLRPSASIVAFEPLAEPAAIYRALFAGEPRVRLHECALAPSRGEMSMHLSARDDSSSLLPISRAQTHNFPGTEMVGIRSVATGPLPDFVRLSELGARSLLKIDVQGFELEVLKSAESLLPQFNWIYVECSFVPLYEGQALAPEVIAFLSGRDFRLAAQFNPAFGKEGALLQADLLFENAKRF